MTILSAFTVWQPWASLIAAGCKPYEFRRWPAPRSMRGRRIAIHAGARPMRRGEIQQLLVDLRATGQWGTALEVEPSIALLEKALISPGRFVLSHVLCTAILGTPIRAAELVGDNPNLGDSDRTDHAMWAWPLHEVVPLGPPVPARGMQGFWPWSTEEIAA